MEDEKQVHILYSKISKDFPEDIYKQYLIFLPEFLRNKYFRYRRWQDRATNLFSIILLIRGLQNFGYDHHILESLKYTQYGRPYLTGSVDFNISHSGDFVLCAIADEVRVGIDIEKIQPVDFSEFRDLMSGEQWSLIKKSQDPLKKFFTYWAIKESIIKADGRGLNIPLNDIVITNGSAYYENPWYLKELYLHERYCAHLATSKETASINLEYVDLNKI